MVLFSQSNRSCTSQDSAALVRFCFAMKRVQFMMLMLAQGGSCLVMLHVRALSGEPVAEPQVEELRARLQEAEELRVVALKRFLGAQLGCSRFRLKLVGEDRKDIDDDVPLIGPAAFTLVRMDFQSSDPATDEQFVAACRQGFAIAVEHLLRAPQNPDALNRRGGRAGIHAAAGRGHVDVVRLLLEARADKDAPMQDGTTALHLASRRGHLDIVRLLLEAGAAKDAAMQDGATALHEASEQGHLDIVRVLLGAGADKDAAQQNGNGDGATSLYLASRKGHLDIVRVLLEAGADQDAESKMAKQLYTQHLAKAIYLLCEFYWRQGRTRMQQRQAASQLCTSHLHTAMWISQVCCWRQGRTRMQECTTASQLCTVHLYTATWIS